MSSFVASLLAEVIGTLLSRPVRLAAELAGTADVNVNDSTPTKLPNSVGDELTSCGSGDAATRQHQYWHQSANVNRLIQSMVDFVLQHNCWISYKYD